MDTKKKELVGEFKNAGREWRPKGQPAATRTHDFPGDGLGKAVPYGVYDISADAGWVSVGTDHDTAAFAVESVRRWWKAAGRGDYPQARRLLITADAGGSNGYRTRAWKAELAALAVETGLEITCCHFPPGTAPAFSVSTASSASGESLSAGELTAERVEQFVAARQAGSSTHSAMQVSLAKVQTPPPGSLWSASPSVDTNMLITGTPNAALMASRSSAVSISEIDVTARSRSRPALCSLASSARVDHQDPHQYGQTQSRISGASSPCSRV